MSFRRSTEDLGQYYSVGALVGDSKDSRSVRSLDEHEHILRKPDLQLYQLGLSIRTR